MTIFGLVGAIFVAVGSPLFIIGVFIAANFDRLINTLEVQGSVWMLPILFIGLGSIIILIGITLIIIYCRKKKHNKKLVEDNHYLWAEIVEFVYDYSVRINWRPGVCILAKYIEPGSGCEIPFRSDVQLRLSPSIRIGNRIKVYYNPEARYKDYYVEVPKT